MDHITQDLIEAVQEGNIANIEYFIAQGADPLVRDSWLLRLATINGDEKTLSSLMQYCDTRAQDSAALRLAAEAGHINCVQLLLPHSDPTVQNNKAFSLAATNNHLAVVKILAPHCSFDINDTNENPEDSVMHACITSADPQIFKTFLDHLSEQQKKLIDYDMWFYELMLDGNNIETTMGMFRLLDPQNHLSSETARDICKQNIHQLDQNMAELVLQRACVDGKLDFIGNKHKYKCLSISATFGRTDLLHEFFKYDHCEEYCVDLMHKMFEIFDYEYRINQDNFILGLECVASYSRHALQDVAGDKLLIAASASGKKEAFEVLLPYCNLERAYADATGTAQELEILEEYNAQRIKNSINEAIDTSGSARKRRM